MNKFNRSAKRVIVIQWKNKPGLPVEVFSNLKLLSQSYPQFNYNTLNNYLSKAKTAFENEKIKIERLPLFSRPLPVSNSSPRSIYPVIVKQPLKEVNEKKQDLEYWLSKPPKERIAAVTFIISQSLKKGQRLDKTMVQIKKQ